jgi:hypothetical protein
MNTSLIKIGDKELVFSETFIVQENEFAQIQVPMPKDVPLLRVRIRFRRRDRPENKPGMIFWNTDDEGLLIDCVGWESNLASVLTNTKKIGEFPQVGKVGLWFSAIKSSEAAFTVTFQVYVGGTYGE